jgi:hypothetical protein
MIARDGFCIPLSAMLYPRRASTRIARAHEFQCSGEMARASGSATIRKTRKRRTNTEPRRM